MPFKDIMFGDYLPDVGGLPADGPYLLTAENVRPVLGGYRPMMIDELVASAATLGATPVSATGFSDATNARHYVGSATALYESSDDGVTWNDNSGAAYSSTGFWDFALFNTYVIAVNGINNPQSKLITDAVTTNFGDLAGSPPVAGRVARIRDHVVLGRLSGNSFAIRFGAIGNPGDWPTVGTADALAKQSDQRELPRELGAVTGLVGGEKFGLVFQISGITRMTYVGGNVVFQLDTFEKEIGTGVNDSIIKVGNYFYFASKIGVFRTDGYSVENLSKGAIEDALIRSLLSHPDAISNLGQSVSYDSRTDTVMWSATISGNTAYLLCYHIAFKRFTIMNMAGTLTSGTLYSVRDSAAQDAQKSIPYAFNTTPKLISFTDSTAVALGIRTGFVELAPGYVTHLTGFELLGKKNSISVNAKSVMDLDSASVVTSGYNAATSPLRSNLYRLRQSGRYHSLWVTDTGNADHIYRGFRVHYELGSKL